MSSNHQYSYKFREFRLDIAERLLLRNERSVALMPKIFDVLALLVERNGHLVEKDELLRIVWEDAFVEETNIARTVHSLRKILGENAANKFIETVPKKGYRFIAEVEKLNGLPRSSNGAPVATKSALPGSNGNSLLPDVAGLTGIQKQNGKQNANSFDEEFSAKAILPDQTPTVDLKKSKLKLQVLGVFLIFTLVIGGIWFYDDVWTTNVNSNQNKSVAVLPLKPINNQNRDPIFELGIAESLILKLSSVKELTVRPLSATRKYQELDQNPTEAGREQQVDFVLSSNYQIVNGKIRVTSQLINTQTGTVEEVFKSEKDSANVFFMQDALANEIGNTILARFGNRENNLVARRGTSNEEAYRLYLQATFIFDQWNKNEIETAIEYLERAVKLDPNFADAFVCLGYAYRHIPGRSFDAQEQVLKSKQAIEKALAIDENLADAHAVLGLLKSNYESDFAGAEKDFERARALNADSPMVLALYANFLIISGRFEEALAQNKKAMEIDPGAAVHQINHGMILYYAHRYDEAFAHFKKLVEKDKNLAYAYFWLWLLADLQNDETQAFEWFMRYQTQIKAVPETIQLYQNAFQKAGWKGVMREMIVEDEKKIKTDDNLGLLYGIACFHARLGNKEKSFEYLEKTFNNRISTITMIKVDPFLDSLHGDPRFERLVKRVGLN